MENAILAEKGGVDSWIPTLSPSASFLNCMDYFGMEKGGRKDRLWPLTKNTLKQKHSNKMFSVAIQPQTDLMCSSYLERSKFVFLGEHKEEEREKFVFFLKIQIILVPLVMVQYWTMFGIEQKSVILQKAQGLQQQ